MKKAREEMLHAVVSASIEANELHKMGVDKWNETFVHALERRGFAIVPIEPSEEMIAAGVDAFDHKLNFGENAKAIYRAMISTVGEEK